MPKKHVKDDFVMCVVFLAFAKGIVQKFFEIPENFCIPARNFLQSLMNRMVKTVFENSIFLPLIIANKNWANIFADDFLW